MDYGSAPVGPRTAFPDPITGDALLVSSTSSPARKNGVAGLNPRRATGPWFAKIVAGAVPQLRLLFSEPTVPAQNTP